MVEIRLAHRRLNPGTNKLRQNLLERGLLAQRNNEDRMRVLGADDWRYEEVWLWADLTFSYYLLANPTLEPTEVLQLEVQDPKRSRNGHVLGNLVRDYHGDRLQWTLLDEATERTLANYPRALYDEDLQHVRLYSPLHKESNAYQVL
jgi:hypothetical protein